MQNEAAKPPKLNGRLVNNAIRRLGGASGLTMVQIKKHFLNGRRSLSAMLEIEFYLKKAVQARKLSIQDGKYKVNETASKRRKSSGGSPKRRRLRSGSRKRSSKPSGSKKRRRSGSKRRRRSKKAAAE